MAAAKPRTAAGPSKGPLVSSDRMLAITGFVVAGLAAFFPWYVFLNQNSLGIHSEGLRLDGHRTGTPGADRPFVPSDRQRAAMTKLSNDDALLTAAIPDLPKRLDPARKRVEQPFPGRTFGLLHVANGQALIADADGMYLVQVGSRLPDNSTLSDIVRVKDGWAIETSDGTTITR